MLDKLHRGVHLQSMSDDQSVDSWHILQSPIEDYFKLLQDFENGGFDLLQ